LVDASVMITSPSVVAMVAFDRALVREPSGGVVAMQRQRTSSSLLDKMRCWSCSCGVVGVEWSGCWLLVGVDKGEVEMPVGGCFHHPGRTQANQA
jgi:hypothetical protein